MRIRSIDVIKPLFIIVVIQKSHEKSRGFAMGADDILLHCFSKLVHIDERLWRGKSLQHGFRDVKQWIIERRIHPDNISVAGRLRIAPDEQRDVLLGAAVKHLSKRKEILLA